MKQNYPSFASAMSNDGIHLPFGELIAVLQAEGFTIKPDDYVELLKVVEKFGAYGAKKLKFRIAPLLCTTEEEQRRFYKIYDSYCSKDDEATETEVSVVRPQFQKDWKWFWIIAWMVLAVAIAIVSSPDAQYLFTVMPGA